MLTKGALIFYKVKYREIFENSERLVRYGCLTFENERNWCTVRSGTSSYPAYIL